MYELLDKINSPEDLRALKISQLRELCSEVRHYMIECCAVNPGHLASSLGAVELIVGSHYVFNTPEDKLLFDVGHQAYAHKILTGRREAFKNNRTSGGISGFPRMDESPYDSFGVGHSSTSISAALGYAEAAKIQGLGTKTVALIGDGALTGGLAFEAMNNAGTSSSDLLIIVNDNNQSIDRNTGGLHNHLLLEVTTSRAYNRLKEKVWNRMGETRARNFIQRWFRSLKAWFVKGSKGDIFEALGLRYFGPIDGNNIEDVVAALRKLKEMKGPKVLHTFTKKGKGFPKAEEDPTTWHAPGKFNPETGERFISPHPFDRYQDVFGSVLCSLAEKDPKIVGITPAMASGCGMTAFAKAFPDRFFDVGIEEEHAVTFAAGLAAAGMKPIVNIYSSFSQRAYDQFIHDVALQGLSVVMCLDRAGLVGEDGATHNGVFDLSAFRPVPGVSIIAPRNEVELKMAMLTAVNGKGPYIIRYPRGMGEGAEWKEEPFHEFRAGQGECLVRGEKIAILGLGPVCSEAIKASEEFATKHGFRPAVYDMRFLKPLDESMLKEISGNFEAAITLEDGTLKGGLFSAVCEWMEKTCAKTKVDGIGVPDSFITHASQKEQRRLCGLSKEGILETLEKLSEKSSKSFGD